MAAILDDTGSIGRRLPRFRWFLFAGLGIVVLAWCASAIAHRVAGVDFGGLDRPYAWVFAFVLFDAVIPIFPSESLLNAGATLAVQDGSNIEIWRLTVAGSLGAIVGDSLLYWISRTVLRPSMAHRVEQAQRNEKVATAFDVLSGSAPQLIVIGRFVPGMRFAVGATMGLTKYPYRRFLLWDSIGSVAWASFACLSSALVATVIQGQPLVSMLVSIVLTTALLAWFYRAIKRDWQAASAVPPAITG